jgi:hypothetical protein
MSTELALDSQEFFGGAVPEAIRGLIDEAKAAPADQIAPRLWAIQAQAPSCLPVYYLLYKLHAGRRELLEAERAALLGLAQSGRLAGLPESPALPSTSRLAQANFAANGPARFWLFTLKALAFISLRRGQVSQADQLVSWIGTCDPSHSVGSDVTAALLEAARAPATL